MYAIRSYYETFYYGPIRHIQEVLRMTEPGGENENEVRHAMAQVVSIMNFVQLADAFGSIPYSDGGVGQGGYLYPEFDSVEGVITSYSIHYTKLYEIFQRSRFEQMKHKDIAEALGISPRTVETQIFRALQFLRDRLKHYL